MVAQVSVVVARVSIITL